MPAYVSFYRCRPDCTKLIRRVFGLPGPSQFGKNRLNLKWSNAVADGSGLNKLSVSQAYHRTKINTQ